MKDNSPAGSASTIAAFTIIEFIAVISIISILALVAYPLILGPGDYRVISATSVIKSDIGLTQISAMTKGESRSIIFREGSGEYLYDATAYGTDGYNRDLEILGGQIIIKSNTTIIFNSLGEPSYLSNNEVIVVSAQKTQTMFIDSFTGKIQIE